MPADHVLAVFLATQLAVCYTPVPKLKSGWHQALMKSSATVAGEGTSYDHLQNTQTALPALLCVGEVLPSPSSHTGCLWTALACGGRTLWTELYCG